MTRAISLLSGGLDSILATKVIIDHGIEVEALNFVSVFCNCTSKGSTCSAGRSAADQLGIPLKVMEKSEEYLDILKSPKHGYGKNINPCLDCRIFIFKRAKEYMEQVGASFIVTGEVLGSRPMSQRRQAMELIERESGLKGLVVRPLCAKLMEPTIPEKEGILDREKLLAIQGRSRKPQIKMAQEFSIADYPCPSGGCLLTYEGFANKVRDLMKNKPDFNMDDAKLLKVGRHFRLSPDAKLVVGRDDNENKRLLSLIKPGDLSFYPLNTNGPLCIGRGRFDAQLLSKASSIVARYSDGNSGDNLTIVYKNATDDKVKTIDIKGADEAELGAMRIC
ncbi:hypothetical protein ACFL0T_06840 [Candidatus Omnitrophota bacterium]